MVHCIATSKWIVSFPLTTKVYSPFLSHFLLWRLHRLVMAQYGHFRLKRGGRWFFILKLNPLSDVFVLLIVEKVLSEGLHSWCRFAWRLVNLEARTCQWMIQYTTIVKEHFFILFLNWWVLVVWAVFDSTMWCRQQDSSLKCSSKPQSQSFLLKQCLAYIQN